MSLTLFITRLILYLTAVSIPALHPAVVVGYELQGILIWFVLVPLEMIIAYAMAPPRMRLPAWLGLGAAPVLLAALIIGIDASPTTAVTAGTLAFALTAALFHLGPRMRFLFAVEQIALGALYLRLLTFSRGSEEIALEAAQGATQLIFLLIVAAFLLHGIVVSMVLARGDIGSRAAVERRGQSAGGNRGFAGTSEKSAGSGKNWSEVGGRRGFREIGVFLALAVPILLVTAFVLPTDFVQHSPVLNFLNPPDHDPPEPLDERARSLMDQHGAEGGSLPNGLADGSDLDQADDGTADGDDFGEDDDTTLSGIAAADWEGSDGESGQDQQRAVMIVRSDVDPTYVADRYRDRFDRVRGFIPADEQPLNDLVRKRLAGTWRNPDRMRNLRRSREEIGIYSTIEDRVLAYRPYEVEPTVYQPRYHPFSFSYESVSEMSTADNRQFSRIGSLSESDQERLADHLEIPLDEEHRQAFEAHIDERIGEVPEGYFARIEAIMHSFEEFQYELGYDDSFRPDHQARFVSETMSGDCVEFATTAALLGRMLGIPSRVVTGYLASSGLQNPAHIRGLAVLQDSIPALADYSLSEMFLVTTSHRHAWVQYYMPGYGWVDFEPTSYAIPPDRAGDPNEREVVIPIIEPRQTPPSQSFPWNEIANVLLWIVIAGLTGLYLFRYGAEAYLSIRARRGDDRAVRARYRLLLMKLASFGYELKGTGETATEYAARYPETAGFADAYTRLRYMPPENDRNDAMRHLMAEYDRCRRGARNGSTLRGLRRIISLRGLYYV